MKKILTLLVILVLSFTTVCFATQTEITPDVLIEMDKLEGEYSFTQEDFSTAFAELEEGELTRVVITTLPDSATGTLKVNGEDITVIPKGIDLADISTLTFTPNTEFTGTTTFTWRGKTAEKSVNTILTTQITVTDEYKGKIVNINVYKNEDYSFKESDFGIFKTIDAGDLTRVVVESLPTETAGILKIDETKIETLPKGIDLKDISSLVFAPAEDFTGTTTFTWRGKTADATDQTIFLTKLEVIEKPNMQAKNLEFEIDKNSTLKAEMKSEYATDAEFNISSNPTHGTLSNINLQTGYFEYKPNKDYVGLDSFNYKVVKDDVSSETAMITITIKETAEVLPFYYEDMQEHWANYSASHLADRNILVGEKINGEYFFYPNTIIKRSDFILNILSALKLKPDDETTTTFKFADDSEIEKWLKPYVYKAYKEGIIHGSLENGKLYFNATKAITRSEAATVINNAITLKVNNNESLTFKDKNDIPEWSLGAIKNMVGYEIITGFEDNTFKPATQITKGELAEMIFKSIKELEKQTEQVQTIE